MSAVYDAGALIAADRDDRTFWADHAARLQRDEIPVVPAGVVAQVSRSPRQVPLRRLLRGCDVVAMDEDVAHRVGALLAAARSSDVVDGHVVVEALRTGATVVTADRGDVDRLLAAAGRTVPVVDV